MLRKAENPTKMYSTGPEICTCCRRCGIATTLTYGAACHRVQVCEIVAVQDGDGGTHPITKPAEGEAVAKQHKKPHPHAFTVCYVRRSAQHRWLSRDVTFCCGHQGLQRQWITAVQQSLAVLSNRPRSLLVFINPHGGRQLAVWIYDRKVAPLLARAGVSADVIRAAVARRWVQCRAVAGSHCHGVLLTPATEVSFISVSQERRSVLPVKRLQSQSRRAARSPAVPSERRSPPAPRPILDIQSVSVVTERANHARDHLREQRGNLDKYDG
ncbi:unnamed protein product [Boreogadus saida]